MAGENEQIDQTLVKVFLTVAEGDAHGGEVESLWATPITDVGLADAYRMENSPFLYRGVSYRDIVEAKDEDGFGLKFIRTLKRGGHSTYQILAPKNEPRFPEFWQMLKDLGCSYESSDEGDEYLYSVDLPPTTDIHQVYAILEDGEREKVWIFQEADVGHNVKR